MEQALTLEVMNVVGCSDPISLPSGTLALINAIEYNVNVDGVLLVKLYTAPWVVQTGVNEDTIAFTDVLTYVAAAPETRIGYGQIGYCQIG
jgi:hypothetical protein